MQLTLLCLLPLPQFPRILATNPTERLQSLSTEEVKIFDYDRHAFPEESLFSGCWEENIKAP